MYLYRPIERIPVDFVEYQTLSMFASGVQCKYVLSVMDHLTRSAVLTPTVKKSARGAIPAIVGSIADEELSSQPGLSSNSVVASQPILQHEPGHRLTVIIDCLYFVPS